MRWSYALENNILADTFMIASPNIDGAPDTMSGMCEELEMFQYRGRVRCGILTTGWPRGNFGSAQLVAVSL